MRLHLIAALGCMLPFVLKATEPVLPSVPATASTPGTLPGDIVVDNTGTATYTIPIDMPPGTGGMVPELSLQYSSSSGNGILGMGWSIGGLSAISRAPSTRLDDDDSPEFTIDPVDLDENDRFLLDGQRLILTAKSDGSAHSFVDYGQDGTLYRTEIESFTTVKAVGQVTTTWTDPDDSQIVVTTDRGPEKFIAYTKSGLIMEYGN
ncbi:MAG: SpvB/TcaC N-terminal domain-containing protein, partial [Verrucomicrobiota bacterium]